MYISLFLLPCESQVIRLGWQVPSSTETSPKPWWLVFLTWNNLESLEREILMRGCVKQVGLWAHLWGMGYPGHAS